MKKLLILSLSLLVLFACKKGDNPLDIIPDVPEGGAGNLPTVTSFFPNYSAQLVDSNSTQAGIQGVLKVVFSDFMDEATMSTNNIAITNTYNGSQPPTGITTEYFSENRTLFIYLDDVPDSGVYLIRLVSGGMTNTYGSPLDNDEDNFADGTPYDDYHSVFYTAPLMDTTPICLQPTITSFSPDTIATSNLQPTISISFDAIMDEATLNTSTITLETESGSPVSLNLLGTTPTSISLQPQSNLTLYTNYTITVMCKDIKRLGDAGTPEYYLILDGDQDGPEAAEPDLQSIFRVDYWDSTLKLSSVTGSATSATFTFNKLANASAINFETIKVFDNIGFVPGELRIYTNSGNTQTLVDYYFMRTASGGRTGFVSKDLEGANGYLFDGNANGIGGEDWDDRNVGF